MFKIFSRSKPGPVTLSYQLLKSDMHSHLIPGIDDGSPDLATSLALIRGMAGLGYTKLITTPHIMWDMYKNNREDILRRLALLQAAVKEEGIPVEIHAAAEYFLDDHVEGLIRNNEPLLTISGNMVLVEFSMAYISHGIRDILFDMQMQGYLPVIAHPERYIYLHRNKEFFDDLKTIGCLFQLNLLSLGGHYGKSVTELANYLLKKEYYNLVGTDLHHRGHLEALQQPAISALVKKLAESGKFRNAEL